MYGSFGAVLAILVVIYRGEYIFEGTTSYKLSNLSHNKNIFIISLDALPGFVTNKILQENKDFQKELRGFTSFTNTTSSGPSTAISWMGISYGKVFNLDAIPPEIQDNHPDPSLISNSNLKVLMLRNDYNTYTYGAVHPRGIWPTLSEFKKLGKLHIDYKSAKGKKNGKEIKSLMELGLYRIIPLYILEAIDKDFLVKIDHKNFSQEIYDFNSYVNELKVTTDKNIMHISHYNFTHVPIVLDATCSIAAKKGSNKFDAMIEQVKCGVNKFIELIKKLKEKGVYDKSQIFLISDHGMYSKIYEDMDINDPLYFHGQIISSKAMKSLGFSSLRYTPSLIFKDFGDNAPFKFDESPRSLVDIAPTVCYSNLSSMECDKIGYDGISLTSPVEKTRERYFFLYSKEDNRKTTSRDNNENLSLYKKVTIRGDNLYDEITRIMMSTYKKISCDEVINFSDPKSLDKVQILGFSKSSKNETFINDNTGMIGFWTEKSCTLSAIEVSIRAKIKSKNILTRMKIFLNNVLVEEIKINSMDFPEPT
ncbi:MAG: hypothetical protein HRT87_05255 [Legionellales bacterium]|nr:hypothetical protein [Legionellales bacterium]